MSRGWAIGSDDFKRSLLVDPLAMKESEAWNEHGPQEVRYLRWQMALDRALTLVPFESRQPAHQSANWKRAIAVHLRATTDVSNGWLADRLQMGSAAYVSKHIGLTQRLPHPDALAILDRLKKVKGEA
jgi:putative transposase